ncbi:DnaJ domain-containing protein, partial [Pavlovales sp. CCMP2436]
SRIDHYKVLDIQKSASPVEVKKAYRKMALRWHPDKNAGSSESIAEAEAKFKEQVNEAYDTLSDPAKKERYDSGVDLEAEVDGHHGHGHQHSHMDPEMFNMFRSFMGGQGGPGGGGGRRPGGGGDGGRGGGGGGRMPRSRFDF